MEPVGDEDERGGEECGRDVAEVEESRIVSASCYSYSLPCHVEPSPLQEKAARSSTLLTFMIVQDHWQEHAELVG